MTLLDVAFVFFSNYPTRLTIAELRFDLHSEEAIFASAHPFSEPTFKLSRNLTVYEAFRSLFTKDKIQSQDGTIANPLGLGVVDMFTLVHRMYCYTPNSYGYQFSRVPETNECIVLYVYTHTQISLFSSFTQFVPDSTGPSTQNGRAQDAVLDSNVAVIRIALARWRALWIAIRTSTPEHVWTTLGFFRNGYNYWLVTQLLVNNKASVDVLVGMDVNCDDTLQQLQSLLKDGTVDM